MRIEVPINHTAFIAGCVARSTSCQIIDPNFFGHCICVSNLTGNLILVWLLIRQRRMVLGVNKDLKSKKEEIHNQKNGIDKSGISIRRLNEKLYELNRSLETRVEERSKQLLLQNQKLSDYIFINAHKLRARLRALWI